jgi:hypothetical protein
MKNQKGFAEFIIILIIAVVALGLLGFSLYENGKILILSPTETLQSTPVPSRNVANWKTYTNDEIGYSIKYPPASSISQCEDIKDSDYPTRDEGVDSFLLYVVPSHVCSGNDFVISHQQNEKKLTAFEYFKRGRKEVDCHNSDKTFVCILEEIIFESEEPQTVEYEITPLLTSNIPSLSVKSIRTLGPGGTEVLVPINNTIIRIYHSDTELTNQILSTFRFEQSNEPDISTWKTYSNTKNGYSFKYPTNWGIGAVCDGDQKKDVVRLGEHLLKHPSQDCGTANIPSPIMFFIDNEIPNFPNYRIVEQRTIKAGNANLQYFELSLQDKSTGGHQEIFIFYTPLPDGKYLISRTGAYPSHTLKENFNNIMSTFRFLK